MKTFKFIIIAAAAATCMLSCSNKPKKANVPTLTQADVDTVSYLIGVNFGYFIKANNFAESLDELNLAEIKKGMEDFINADGDPRGEDFNKAFKINPETMNQVFDKYIGARNEYFAQKNLEEGQNFLKGLEGNANVKKSESGLLYEIIEAGDTTKMASAVDTVYCHYCGTLIDGTVFDETKADGEPVSFTLQHVIPGWTEGLQLVGEGGHIKLYVPSSLAYGERNMGKIKANSTLIFDVTVEKVGKTPVEEEK